MSDPVPEWADSWAKGTCGCGSRLVHLCDYTGRRHLVCFESAWDADKCLDKQAEADR